MKNILVFVLAGALLFACLPVSASEEEDFILNEIAEWTNVINTNGYTILDIRIGEISDDDLVWTFELAPGTYYFYGSGGMRVQDIDSYILDESGRELDADDSSDKIPKMKIKLDQPATIQLGITPFSYIEDYTSDYVCFIAASDGPGEILGFDGDVSDAVEPPPVRNPGEISIDEVYMEEMQFKLDEFLDYRSLDEPGSVQSGIVLVDPADFVYRENLESGIYQAFVFTDSRVDDYSLNVINADDESIAEGTLAWRNASANFGIKEASEIALGIDMTFSDETDATEAYAVFLIRPVCGVDEESRMEYVLDSMDDTLSWMEEQIDYEVITSDYGSLSFNGSPDILEFELDEGIYYLDCYGGPSLRDIGLILYDSDGGVIFRDERVLSAAFGEIEATEPMTVRAEITAMDWIIDVPEEYYYYVLMKIVE